MSVRLSVCMYVCLYACLSGLGGNVIFVVQIPLINEHLFCKYFVRLSVGNATKGFATATYGCFHPCYQYKH